MESAILLSFQESTGSPETSQTSAETVNGAATELTPIRPLIPTCAGDWESRKQIIRELYMDQNMILNEVIEIMVNKYKFKATQVFLSLWV